MIAILRREKTWLLIKCQLRPDPGIGVVGEMEITRVPHGVCLHPRQESLSLLREIEKFLAAIDILDARPHVILVRELERTLREVAVEWLRLPQGASASPKQRACPVAARERAVVADRARHPQLIVVGRENFRTHD